MVMARAEVILTSGVGGMVFDIVNFAGEAAISEGYRFFMDTVESRADWLVGASAKRDFAENLSCVINLRIGPWPKWSEEYLKKHDLGRFAILKGWKN